MLHLPTASAVPLEGGGHHSSPVVHVSERSYSHTQQSVSPFSLSPPSMRPEHGGVSAPSVVLQLDNELQRLRSESINAAVALVRLSDS